MKKIICLVLAVIMISSFLVACQGNQGNNNLIERRYEQVINGVKDGVEAYFDGKETVRIYTRDDAGGSTDGGYNLLEFKGNASLNKALSDSVLKRNDEVAGRLGISIEVVAENGGQNNADAWNDKVRTAATGTENDLFDICALYASQGSVLAAQGAYLDVNLLPTLNLNQKYWNQILKDELDIDGSLFMLCGDISLTSTAFSSAVFYNKALYDEYFANNAAFNAKYGQYAIPHTDEEIEAGYTLLHDIVTMGNWTITTLSDLASTLVVESNGQENPVYGMSIDQASTPCDAWVAALDVQYITNTNGNRTLSFETNPATLFKATSAWEEVKKLLTANAGVNVSIGAEIDTNGAVKQFSEGKSVFTMARLCDIESLRDISSWEYGILPLPKYTPDQKDYYTLPQNAYSLIAVAANLPDSRFEVIGATLEVLGSESLKRVTPTYFNSILKSQYSDKQVDADMYDLVLDNIKLDFVSVFSTRSLNGISNTFRQTTTSVSSDWQEYGNTYKARLETLVDQLKEQAALQNQ